MDKLDYAVLQYKKLKQVKPCLTKTSRGKKALSKTVRTDFELVFELVLNYYLVEQVLNRV